LPVLSMGRRHAGPRARPEQLRRAGRAGPTRGGPPRRCRGRSPGPERMTDPDPPGPWRVHDPQMPLAGVRVLDAGTVVAGPGIAARLGDFGADVIKVEHPDGDTTRTMGWAVGGVTLWSKWIDRNKRPVTLNLSKPRGQELLLRLAATADVFVESFRPGT